jgi:hypothetical protein
MKKKRGARGEAHFNSKLTEEQVKDIFARADTTRHKILAREYNIHPTTVAGIRGGLRWRHLNLKNTKEDGMTLLT